MANLIVNYTDQQPEVQYFEASKPETNPNNRQVDNSSTMSNQVVHIYYLYITISIIIYLDIFVNVCI